MRSDELGMLKLSDLFLVTFGCKCAARRVACALARLVGFTIKVWRGGGHVHWPGQVG